MIASFRSTVVNWLELTLQADLYISAPAPGGRARSPAPAGGRSGARRRGAGDRRGRDHARRPGRAAHAARSSSPCPTPRAPVTPSLYRFAEGDPAETWARVRQGAVLVSEPFAARHGVPARGGSVTLQSDAGSRTFEVAGVYYDYATERGTVLMAREVYERHWNDRARSSVAAYVAPGHDPEERWPTPCGRALSRHGVVGGGESHPAAGGPEGLRPHLCRDRSPAPARGDRGLHRGVERPPGPPGRADPRAGHAAGAGPRFHGQLWGLTLLETGLIGLSAGLLSLPTGLLLAVILIDVINVRSFGWTMRLELSPLVLAQALARERAGRPVGRGLPGEAPRAPERGRGPAAGIDARVLRRRSRRSWSAPRWGRPPTKRGFGWPAPSRPAFARVTEPRSFRLPVDHGPHFEFQTEWWYYTGNLAADDGRRFGFQLTFFRRGLSPGPPRHGTAWPRTRSTSRTSP